MLVTALVTLSINTKSQSKSGILQKDHYGTFNGNDWEDFLAGRRAAEFEKKANVKLDDYLKKMVTPFVKEQLKEEAIASAVANSTVVIFPEGVDVYTSDTQGNWITRKAYPGEKGFFHTPTGLYWLSFSCGNLTAFGNKKPQDMMTYNKPNPQSTPPANNGGGNVNNVTVGGNNTSWNEGYGMYSAGRNDRQADMANDALIFMAIQNNTPNCSTCGTGQSQSQTQMAAMPIQYVAAQAPAAQQVVYTTQGGGNRVNALDVINTAANVAQTAFYGVNTFRGYRLEGARNSYSNSGYYGGSYYNNGTGGPVQGGFISSGSGGGYYNNGGGSTTGGGGSGPVQGTGFNW